MCGLVGVAGNVSAKEEQVFKQLLQLDTIRGPHSTGMLAVDAKGNWEVLKKVGTPWDLCQYKAWDEIFRISLCVLMGHNRWATKGKINSVNAHPFEHGHIIGAHNGTLRNQSLLPDHKDFEVDSDNIFYSMSQIGVDDTIAKTHGAFALTWYDAEQETMNFIRNDERPLFLAETEDSKTVFWASERWMLEVVLGVAGIKYKEPFQPKVGQLFTYHLELGYTTKAFKEVKVRDVELYVPPVYNNPKTGSAALTTTVAGKSANGNVSETRNGKKLITPSDLILQKRVEFFVSSLETSQATRAQWISCGATQDDCEIELRLYVTEQATVDWMMKSVHLFEGEVRSFATLGGNSYCTLDPRTIIELIEPDPTLTNLLDDEEEEFAVVYGGEIVAEDEYDLMVTCGCGNCKAIPNIAESADLVWLDKLNFICGECKDLPIVKDFIDKSVDLAN